MQAYESFILNIKNRYDIDLSLYKEKQMKRRITSLAAKHQFDTLEAFYHAIILDPKIRNIFFDRLTINVTQFYRNAKRWDVLREKVFPKFIAENKLDLKIWSAACSTGEEPYSIAIMLQEHFPEIKPTIIATDFDAKIIEEAKIGRYKEHALKELPPHKINKYFSKINNEYVILDYLKENITFYEHDLLKDAFPIGIDLIVCRNVLIYFTDQAKETIYHKFSNALNENGILFLGSTEQIFKQKNYNLALYDTFFYERTSGNVRKF